MKGLINEASLRGLNTVVEQCSVQEPRPFRRSVHEDSDLDLRLRALSVVSCQSEVLAAEDIFNLLSR